MSWMHRHLSYKSIVSTVYKTHHRLACTHGVLFFNHRCNFQGMWANSDDEDTPGFGRGRRKKKDYTAPIGFVSGGIKQGSKIKKEGDDDDSSVSMNILLGNYMCIDMYTYLPRVYNCFSPSWGWIEMD